MDGCRSVDETLLAGCEAFHLIPTIKNNFTYKTQCDVENPWHLGIAQGCPFSILIPVSCATGCITGKVGHLCSRVRLFYLQQPI